jgi:hypothetical protein
MAGPFKHIKSFASEGIGVFGMFFGKAVAEGGCEELWLGAAEISPAGGLGDAGRCWEIGSILVPFWFRMVPDPVTAAMFPLLSISNERREESARSSRSCRTPVLVFDPHPESTSTMILVSSFHGNVCRLSSYLSISQHISATFLSSFCSSWFLGHIDLAGCSSAALLGAARMHMVGRPHGPPRLTMTPSY